MKRSPEMSAIFESQGLFVLVLDLLIPLQSIDAITDFVSIYFAVKYRNVGLPIIHKLILSELLIT